VDNGVDTLFVAFVRVVGQDTWAKARDTWAKARDTWAKARDTWAKAPGTWAKARDGRDAFS